MSLKWPRLIVYCPGRPHTVTVFSLGRCGSVRHTMQQEMFFLMSHEVKKLNCAKRYSGQMCNQYLQTFQMEWFLVSYLWEMDILWVCLIGYMYSCTSVAIFLFKLLEVYDSIYFVKTGISLLFFNISSKKKWGIWWLCLCSLLACIS